MVFPVTRRPPPGPTRARPGKVRPFAPRAAAAAAAGPGGAHADTRTHAGRHAHAGGHAHARRRASLTQDRADAPSGASASPDARPDDRGGATAAAPPASAEPGARRSACGVRAGRGPDAARAERAVPPQRNAPAAAAPTGLADAPGPRGLPTFTGPPAGGPGLRGAGVGSATLTKPV